MSNPLDELYRALPRVNRIDGNTERYLVADHADLIADVLQAAVTATTFPKHPETGAATV